MDNLSLLLAGSEHDKRAVSLGTRRTKHIENLMRSEWDEASLREDLRKMLETYPDIIFNSASATYNCVGMVFATRRTWVDPSHVYKFLLEDDYRKIVLEDIKAGDVVVYKKPSIK